MDVVALLQGDVEKNLGWKPIPLFDRDNYAEVASMQVRFVLRQIQVASKMKVRFIVRQTQVASMKMNRPPNRYNKAEYAPCKLHTDKGKEASV